MRDWLRWLGAASAGASVTEADGVTASLVPVVPDRSIVELKSLKLYLNRYRDEHAFHEAVINQIADDLVGAIDPRWLELVGDFNAIPGRILIYNGSADIFARWLEITTNFKEVLTPAELAHWQTHAVTFVCRPPGHRRRGALQNPQSRARRGRLKGGCFVNRERPGRMGVRRRMGTGMR